MNENGSEYSVPETSFSETPRVSYELGEVMTDSTEISNPVITEVNATNSGEFAENTFDEKTKEVEIPTSQEIAERAHETTKQNMLEQYGRHMSTEQIELLRSDETNEKLKVLSGEEYTETFPNVDVNVLGHCDLEGNIYMKDISPEITDHVSTHETMHLCANRENYVDENGNRVIISGLRESRFNENGRLLDMGQGVNEGTTEMYTVRELQNRGEVDAAYSLHSYSESRIWSERLEKLVGDERLSAAYFGGERGALKEEFNRLNDNDSAAWENYARDIDILEYSNDLHQIEQAKWRLMSQYKTMVDNKYGK